ncbi:hypothetical protein TNCT_583161 [Trichonephila clavata]|uniref:Uncharacterized protein n=1 Tax=Trichonephila clavata TaxID=2740835 RepID=A0A8X6GJ71_TRICU|nr:hypothetical protein TNCT_583161 [Trichonephila clavata]
MGVATLLQLPYSPDMTSVDFFLFPKVKRNLTGTQYGSKGGTCSPFFARRGCKDTSEQSVALLQQLPTCD